MSKQASADSLEAMKDADLHAAGVKHVDAHDAAKVHGHEHTKPEGDLRQVELKEDVAKVTRGEATRGH